MKSRLVIWGTNNNEERVLLAISLNADENKVDIWSISEADITEDFYNQMMSHWRVGSDLDFPGSAAHRVIELTMADTILPDDLKVEKSDVVQRAQMEWHFVVLSTKLYKNFKNQLEDLSDKIKRLEEFDENLWNELRDLWAGVQQHIFDKNILRDHSDSLREKSNALFDELKKLRKARQSVMSQKSRDLAQQFSDKLSAITAKIESGAVIKPLIDEMIAIQKDIKQRGLLRKDFEALLARINENFNLIRSKRESRPQHRHQDEGAADKFNKRYEGLLGAIKRLEDSIAFERKNIDFENRRIAVTDGQLEAQIRVAKIRMIEERLKSKEAKLEELLATREKLDRQQASMKKREEKNQKRLEQNALLEAEKEKVKAQIADSIVQSQENIPEDVQDKLTKAAEALKEVRKKGSRKKDLASAEPGEAKESSSATEVQPEQESPSSHNMDSTLDEE
ncbi:MAG: hypothetical protein KBF37_04595 [Saprospiraceae bacterium]|jgi:DNA repair exonuclease SbcCD ATPase subunit|nr:hypothetical protein [Saprospiraceae bacterium]MBP9209585.1 hypothetical protein [Saprospiraceae bacterium]